MTTAGLVAIRPVTPELRATTTPPLPELAEFAVVASTPAGGERVILTDANVVNILATGRAVAITLGCRFIEPDATCERCARPVPAGTHFCQVRGRDCEALVRGSEVAYWRNWFPAVADEADTIARLRDFADQLGLPQRAAA